MPESLHDSHVDCLRIKQREHMLKNCNHWLDEPREVKTDEFDAAWAIHEKIDQCKASIERWQRLEQNAPTPSEAIAAEQKLATLHQELASLNRQVYGGEPDTEEAANATTLVSASAPADAPEPLTISDIAYCFAGLRWDEQGWKKLLGDKPKWLRSCIAIPGKRGVHETRWNPMLIGAALVQSGHAKPNSVRARFQSKPRLSAWLEAWKTYEADYFDTE